MEQKQPGIIRRFMNKPIVSGIVITILFLLLLRYAPEFPESWNIPIIYDELIFIAFIIVIYVCYTRYFKDELPNRTSAKSIMKGLACLAPLLVMATLVFLTALAMFIVSGGNGVTGEYLLKCFVSALSAGVCEEIVLRGLFSENMMRVSTSSKDIMKNALIPSLVFGVCHLTNILSGAGIYATIGQVFSTFGIGFLYSAALFRTGTIIPGVICHTFVDFSSFFIAGVNNGAAETIGRLSDGANPVMDILKAAMMGIVAFLCGMFVLRKKKREEICEVFSLEYVDNNKKEGDKDEK